MGRAKEIRDYVEKHNFNQAVDVFNLKPSTVRRYMRNYGRSGFPKILLLDIETSPIHFRAWDTGKQYVSYKQITKPRYVICWAGRWLYSNEVLGECVTPRESKKRNHKRIIKPVWDLMNDADIIVGHSVRSFDIKQLNARFIGEDIQGGAPPMPYNVVDTLTISRSNFKLPSHSQDYLTKYLKLPEKLKTEIELWHGCESGDKESLKYMFKYCKGDVFGLEELYLKLRPWARSHPNVALYGDMEEKACGYCGSSSITLKGKYYTPVNKYKAYRCECGAPNRSRLTEISKGERENLIRSSAK